MDRTPKPETEQPLRDDNSYQCRLHHGRHNQRRQVIAAARSADPRHRPDDDDPDDVLALKIATKLECCGRGAAIWWSDDAARVIPVHCLCKSRCCPTCAATRARRNIAIITPALEQMFEPKMLTLTLRSNDQPLRESIKRLQSAFQKFRRKKRWKQHVTGGISIVEITFNPTSRQWHAHLHLLIDSRRWDWREIRGFWQEITGDSTAIDIRVIHDRRRVAGYVASYTQKATTAPTTDPDRLREWMTAINRLRMMQTFGTLHGQDRDRDDDARPTLTEQLCNTADLIDSAAQNNPAAIDILAGLRALRSRPKADAEQGVLDHFTARNRDLARKIRTWRSSQQNHDIPHPPDPDDPAQHVDHSDLWTVWDGQIDHPQEPATALAIAQSDTGSSR